MESFAFIVDDEVKGTISISCKYWNTASTEIDKGRDSEWITSMTNLPAC